VVLGEGQRAHPVVLNVSPVAVLRWSQRRHRPQILPRTPKFLIGSIVISLSCCCLPNDERPGPQILVFFLEPGMWSRSRRLSRDRDVQTSRLGLVSTKMHNVSVSSRTCASQISSRSRPKTSRDSRRLVSGLWPFRLVETFHAGAPNLTTILQ